MDSKFKYGEGSNVGLVRSNNEDAALSAPDIGLFLIADGMGGHDAGEVASQIVKESVLASIQDKKPLKDAIHKSHKDIKDAAANNIGSPNMGTTIVALLSKGNNYQVAWVGDSRAYHWSSSSNQLHQISKDHSYVQALFDAGSISKAEMDTHPQKNIITQSLGVSDLDSVVVDSIDREWQPDDKILLCSDGLTDLVSDQEISHTFRKLRDKSNQELVDTLIQAALDKGGVDNVSIQVISAPELAKNSLTDKLSKSKHVLALIAICIALTATLLWLLFK